MKTVELKVEGMTCDGCVRAVESVLTRLEGVEAAHVSLEEGRARVPCDPGEVSVEAMTEAIGKIGFQATPLDEADRS